MIFDSLCSDDTFRFGEVLGEKAKKGEIYVLNGELGTGKTVLTQGFGKGLGINEAISSPTFTILQEYYEGRIPFYHLDVYRITDVEEMEEIGIEDIFYGQGLCLIEWGEMIKEILPENVITITIEKNLEKGFDYRKIIMEGKDIQL